MENLNDDTLTVDTLQLEELVKEERDKDITQLNALSKKVCNLHSHLLYYRNPGSKIGLACYEAWRVTVNKVGGTPNGWRDLGYALGVSQDDLDYIMAQTREDPGDLVLKVYQQNEKATIDKITDAFVKMKRYDILKALEKPLCDIAQYFIKDDSGYQSKENSTGQREIVGLKNFTIDLPSVLNKNLVSKQKKPDRPKPSPLPPTSTSESVASDHPILFLTFAQDGLPTAINIQDYVDSWTEMEGVEVVTLSQKNEMYQNPEMFIREYFEKADFIVPIITPGYIDEIKSNSVNPNSRDNLDHRYVKFIYNLIVNHYIASGCLNMKVRSVLPQNCDGDIYRNIHMYPDLLPWTYETNFDEQFQQFLKK